MCWIVGRRSEVQKPLKSNTVGYIPLFGMAMCNWCPLGQVMNTRMVQTRTPLKQVVPIGLTCSALRSSYNQHWYLKYLIFFTLVVTSNVFLYIITHFAQMSYLGGLSHIRSADSQTSIEMLWQNMDM